MQVSTISTTGKTLLAAESAIRSEASWLFRCALSQRCA